MYISLITSKKKEELIRAFTDVLKQSGHFDCIQSDSEFIHLESFFKDQEIGLVCTITMVPRIVFN